MLKKKLELKKILNNTKVTSSNDEMLNKYSERVIYFVDLYISEVVKNKFGYKKTVKTKLKDQVWCEFRFKETPEYFENEIKAKIIIKKEKIIVIEEVFLKCVLGNAYIRNN
jgi:hypothetical protein